MSGVIAFLAILAIGGVLIYAAWPKEPSEQESDTRRDT